MNKMLMMILSLACAPLFAHELAPEADLISVTGYGMIEEEPDMVTLRVTISAEAARLTEAKSLADRRYKSALKQIKKARIDDKHIKATRIHAQPQYEWASKKRVYRGELVSRSLSIKVFDLGKLPELMQALVEHGISTIDGVDSGFSNEYELKQKALGAAADDAKQKARFLAKRLGRELGVVSKINAQNAGSPRRHVQQARMMTAEMDKASAPPELFGTQRITSQVHVVFNLR